MPDISKPKSFALRSESDLSEELKNNEELPDAVKGEITKEYLNVRFGNKSNLEKEITLKQKVDNFYLQTPVNIAAIMASGYMPKWKAVLHYSFDSYIAQQDESFWDLSFDEQKAILENLAKADTTANTTGSTDNLIA